VPLGTLRNLIQERGERLLSQLREGPIGRLIPGGEGGPAAEAAPVPAEPPVPPPAPAPAPTTDAEKHAAKNRLTEFVESSKHTFGEWQHNVDERIRSIVPGLGAFRDLSAEVKRLAQRVDELEARLARIDGHEGADAAPKE
jgi:hypothetical protein